METIANFYSCSMWVMGRRSFAWLQLDTITRATQHMWVEAVGLDDLWSADVKK